MATVPVMQADSRPEESTERKVRWYSVLERREVQGILLHTFHGERLARVVRDDGRVEVTWASWVRTA